MASANVLARVHISSSVSRGIECADLRLAIGRFVCEASVTVATELEDEEAEEFEATGFAGCEGKKHLKIPSACHLVAWVKLTHTSIRPGRLKAGSKRSMWFVVANKSL